MRRQHQRNREAAGFFAGMELCHVHSGSRPVSPGCALPLQSECVRENGCELRPCERRDGSDPSTDAAVPALVQDAQLQRMALPCALPTCRVCLWGARVCSPTLVLNYPGANRGGILVMKPPQKFVADDILPCRI